MQDNLRERYKKLYAGVIYDALCFDLKYEKPFVVNHTISNRIPSTKHEVLFGQAITCKGAVVNHESHIDDDVRLRMFEQFTPGCIQVIDTDQHDSVAHFGDISGKIARQYGAIAAVIDGYTRDVRLIDEDAFPVFCKGAMPVDAYGKWQIVDYQCPVYLPGVSGRVEISPDDYLFCDPDGVLLVPKSLVSEVCKLAEKRLTSEEVVRHEIKHTDDLVALREKVGRW